MKGKLTPSKLLSFFKDALLLTVSSIMVAASINYFLVPSNIVDGGMTGVALIIVHFTGQVISIGTLILVLNLILLLLAVLLIGPEFSLKTVYVSVILGPLVDLWEKLLPWESISSPCAFTGGLSLMGDLAWDMMAYLVLFGISEVMLFLDNASSGGVDVLAKLVNHFTGINMNRSLALVSYPIILGGLFVNDFKLVVVSIIVALATEWIMDYFTNIFVLKKQATIVTSQPEPIKEFITATLGLNCEIVDSLSGKSGDSMKEIDATLSRYQFSRLKSFIDHHKIQAHVRAVDISDYS